MFTQMMKNLLATILITATTGLNTINTRDSSNITNEQQPITSATDYSNGQPQNITKTAWVWNAADNTTNNFECSQIYFYYNQLGNQQDNAEITNTNNPIENYQQSIYGDWVSGNTWAMTEILQPKSYLTNITYTQTLKLGFNSYDNTDFIVHMETYVGLDMIYKNTPESTTKWTYNIREMYFSLLINTYGINYTKYQTQTRYGDNSQNPINEISTSVNINLVSYQDNYIFSFIWIENLTREDLYIDDEWVNLPDSRERTVTANVIAQPNQEVIDVPNLLWTVLTMPFSFISQAFNLTIFPNTPYSFNFANLFLSIIGIFIFIWIMSIVVGFIKK